MPIEPSQELTATQSNALRALRESGRLYVPYSSQSMAYDLRVLTRLGLAVVAKTNDFGTVYTVPSPSSAVAGRKAA